MSGGGKIPLDIQVRSKADKYNAFASLWDPVVCSVQHLGKQGIAKAFVIGSALCLGVMALKAAQVIIPILIRRGMDFWILKLQLDIQFIRRKRRTREPLHIFENKGVGLNFSDGSHRLTPHIPFVSVGFMLSA